MFLTFQAALELVNGSHRPRTRSLEQATMRTIRREALQPCRLPRHTEDKSMRSGARTWEKLTPSLKVRQRRFTKRSAERSPDQNTTPVRPQRRNTTQEVMNALHSRYSSGQSVLKLGRPRLESSSRSGVAFEVILLSESDRRLHR